MQSSRGSQVTVRCPKARTSLAKRGISASGKKRYADRLKRAVTIRLGAESGDYFKGLAD